MHVHIGDSEGGTRFECIFWRYALKCCSDAHCPGQGGLHAALIGSAGSYLYDTTLKPTALMHAFLLFVDLSSYGQVTNIIIRCLIFRPCSWLVIVVALLISTVYK